MQLEGLWLFTSVAYLHDKADDRLMVEPITGIHQNDGMRAALGANVARTLLAHQDRGRDDATWMLLVLPQQAKLAVASDAGSTRFGATLSWGF